jgi:hypothetical protein
VVLFAGTAADTDRADDFAILFQRDAAGEDHDAAVVGGIDAEELAAGLGVGGEVFGGGVEGAGGVGLLDRDVDAAEPGAVHADVGDEVAAGVGDGDVHGLTDCGGLGFGGGDDAAGVVESDHGRLLCSNVLMPFGGRAKLVVSRHFPGGAMGVKCVAVFDAEGSDGVRVGRDEQRLPSPV